MAGSIFGTVFRVSTWGESHGEAVGVVVDGVPAGLFLSTEDIQSMLDRRRPGQSSYSTARDEKDLARILSGVFNGYTTGTPISILVKNEDHHSADYDSIKDIYRPGHADFTYDKKYGFRDYRGGGRSSARETIGRVAAGAVAKKLLSEFGIRFLCYTKSIGAFNIKKIDERELYNNPLYMPDEEAAREAMDYIEYLKERNDSIGGVVECRIFGIPTGLGEPVFDKLDAKLAQAMLSIGAVKGFEIGEGFLASRLIGSENNDPFISEDGHIKKLSNHAGGVLGGISDGSELRFRVAIKPTPSISSPQDTVDRNGNEVSVSVRGRHDPVIVPRAVVVVEAMAALVLADLLLMNAGARVDYLHRIYG